jgi:hypothetical protein
VDCERHPSLMDSYPWIRSDVLLIFGVLAYSYVDRRFNFVEKAENSATNEVDSTKKESTTYLEEKKCA